MATGKKRATIIEIARLANTSTATVSRVLNGSDYPVSDELRESVKRAAEEVGYVPNAFGQSLKNGKTKDIGVIIPNFTNPFYMQMISGIEKVCRDRGYNPIICSSNNSEDQELANIALLRQKCVEGLIISSIHKTPLEIQAALSMHKNVVLFDQETTLPDCDYVSFDFENGGYMAVNYLLKKGHRNIAFLTAPLERRGSRRALYQGCQRAIREWSGPATCTLVVEDVAVDDYTRWEYENGRQLASRFLQLKDRPTAVFVYNDITAIGVMSQLMKQGLQLPQDVSVVGFDNIIMSEFANPPLTTICQPAAETGSMAAQMIIDKIEGFRSSNCRINLTPQLIERESVSFL